MLNHFAMMAGEKAKDMAVFKREGDGLDLLYLSCGLCCQRLDPCTQLLLRIAKYKLNRTFLSLGALCRYENL